MAGTPDTHRAALTKLRGEQTRTTLIRLKPKEGDLVRHTGRIYDALGLPTSLKRHEVQVISSIDHSGRVWFRSNPRIRSACSSFGLLGRVRAG